MQRKGGPFVCPLSTVHVPKKEATYFSPLPLSSSPSFLSFPSPSPPSFLPIPSPSPLFQDPYEYIRGGNPTRDVFEKCIATLEGGKYGERSFLREEGEGRREREEGEGGGRGEEGEGRREREEGEGGGEEGEEWHKE